MKTSQPQKNILNQWVNYTVDQICSLVTNGFVGTATTHYTDNSDGVLYIQGYNLKEGGFNFKGIKKVTQEFHKKNSKSDLKYKDLLTIQTGDCGLTSLVPKELEGANCHALIISRFKSEIINSYFIFYFYNSEIGRSKLKRIETGSTMKHLNVSDLKALELSIPPLPEQNRIVSVLETWDQAIETLTKKIEMKRQIKKGLMQDLLTGQKRLGGFKGDWRTVKLGTCLFIKHGKPQKDVESANGQYPILGTGGEFGRATKFLYDKPSVLIGRKGTIDKPKYMDQPFWTVDTLFYSEIKKCNNAKFLYYLFLTINWKLYNEGSGVPSLSASTIATIKVFIPMEENEQTAIANILTAADNEITTLQNKLSLLKDQKKYLLNNLITGAIRTPEDLTVRS